MAYLRRNDKLLVIIGPSGAGKSSIVRHLEAAGIVSVTPSWTTRPKRPEERHGALEHHFVSEAEFKHQQAAGFFLEAVQLFGLPYWYGLPKIVKPPKSQVPLVMLRVNLLPLLAQFYDNFTVYQIEDEIAKMKTRLLDRQEAGQQLGSRLTDIQTEITAGRKVAKRTFVNNSELPVVAKRLQEAIAHDFAVPQ